MKQRIGFLGGAFNPPHYGHLRPAREALDRLKLDKILFIPSGEHPLKSPHGLAPAHHRLAMTRLAIDGEPRFDLSALEVETPGISYTVQTLETLAALYPDWERIFLIGGDIVRELHRWHRWHHLLDHTHLAIMRRPGAPPSLTRAVEEPQVADFLRRALVEHPDQLDQGQEGGCRVIELPVTGLDLSSSQMRAWRADRVSCRFATPEAVIDYMDLHQLYSGKNDHGQ